MPTPRRIATDSPKKFTQHQLFAVAALVSSSGWTTAASRPLMGRVLSELASGHFRQVASTNQSLPARG